MPYLLTVGRASALVALVLLMLPAKAASAHPFGPPPTALLTAEGTTIEVEWRSAPDDAAAIGVVLGFLEESAVSAYLEAPVQVAAPARDEEALSASDDLRTYLTERIVVWQDDRACPATVPPVADFVHGGARVVLRCPEAIGEVEVEITMLHDVHDAYRTFGITASEAAEPAQTVFTSSAPRQRIDFSAAGGGPAPPSGGGHLARLAILGGVVLAVGGLWVGSVRRGRRRMVARAGGAGRAGGLDSPAGPGG
jgi:hypothetical protein